MLAVPCFPQPLTVSQSTFEPTYCLREILLGCNVVSAKSILTITNYSERGPNVKEHGTIEPKKLLLKGAKSVPVLNRWGTECPSRYPTSGWGADEGWGPSSHLLSQGFSQTSWGVNPWWHPPSNYRWTECKWGGWGPVRHSDLPQRLSLCWPPSKCLRSTKLNVSLRT